MLQEKLSSKIEKLEALEVVVEKLRKKKIYIMILFAGIFSLVGNNKLEVKFVILFANFKVRGKNPIFLKFHDIRCQYP